MKITATPPPSFASWDANPGSQARTNFQQLVEQLEQDMWSGAKAGQQSAQTLPPPDNARAYTVPTPQRFSPLSAADAAMPSNAPSAVPETTWHVAPALSSPPLQLASPIVPTLQIKQDSRGTQPPTHQACFPLPARPPLNTGRTSSAEQSPITRMPQQTTPTTTDGDRLHLLPGTSVPAVVVRYTGSCDDLPLLKRALQDVLRRHGINETSLTINGFDAIARIEHGADHGR